jgi:nucleoside-diphosphate-sugar epimerase
MHLVVGAEGFAGGHVADALSKHFPIRLVVPLGFNFRHDSRRFHVVEADFRSGEGLDAAMTGVDVVYMCAETWSPANRLRYQREPSPVLRRLVESAQRAGARRLVHLSTIDVFGSDHKDRLSEISLLKPLHHYERLKAREEEWLRAKRGDLELVIVRAARTFGPADRHFTLPLLRRMETGLLWLPGRGAIKQTFITGPDLGRAVAAGGFRGRNGATYLVGGFDATWAELLEAAAFGLGQQLRVWEVPYDLSYLAASLREMRTRVGQLCWPNCFTIDVLSKPHLIDGSRSRRELTWSPQVSTFDEGMGALLAWYRSVRKETLETVETQTAP